jgi:hypothetical protein
MSSKSENKECAQVEDRVTTYTNILIRLNQERLKLEYDLEVVNADILGTSGKIVASQKYQTEKDACATKTIETLKCISVSGELKETPRELKKKYVARCKKYSEDLGYFYQEDDDDYEIIEGAHMIYFMSLMNRLRKSSLADWIFYPIIGFVSTGPAYTLFEMVAHYREEWTNSSITPKKEFKILSKETRPGRAYCVAYTYLNNVEIYTGNFSLDTTLDYLIYNEIIVEDYC